MRVVSPWCEVNWNGSRELKEERVLYRHPWISFIDSIRNLSIWSFLDRQVRQWFIRQKLISRWKRKTWFPNWPCTFEQLNKTPFPLFFLLPSPPVLLFFSHQISSSESEGHSHLWFALFFFFFDLTFLFRVLLGILSNSPYPPGLPLLLPLSQTLQEKKTGRPYIAQIPQIGSGWFLTSNDDKISFICVANAFLISFLFSASSSLLFSASLHFGGANSSILLHVADFTHGSNGTKTTLGLKRPQISHRIRNRQARPGANETSPTHDYPRFYYHLDLLIRFINQAMLRILGVIFQRYMKERATKDGGMDGWMDGFFSTLNSTFYRLLPASCFLLPASCFLPTSHFPCQIQWSE